MAYTKKQLATIMDELNRCRFYQTRNYRYIVRVENYPDYQQRSIYRLPVEYLGTTAALDGWEYVTTYK